jgi:hypothetical protein
LKASNLNGGDNFGARVAISGDFLVVGAPNEASDGSSPSSNGKASSGAVYLFERVGATWQETGYFKAPVPAQDELFGVDLAIDAQTLLVGAVGESSGPNGTFATDSGAAYVFR